MRSARVALPMTALLVLALATAWPWAPAADGQDRDLTATPQLECGPGSEPEGEIQGRVPAEDYTSGRVERPYTCNAELVGHHGATGGFKVHRYVDAHGRECAYYDSTLLLPTDLLTQASTGLGVIVLDLADPSNPVMTAQLTTPAMLSPHEALELNQERGLLAAVTGTAATYPGIVDVYDLSQDCTRPVLQASAPVGFLGHESGFAPDGMTFYTASTAADSIVAVDLTDPTAPTPVAFIPMQSHGIQVSEDGTRLYATVLDVGDAAPLLPTTGELDGGIAILDVSAIDRREPLAGAEVIAELTWPEVSIPQTAIPVTIDGSEYLVEIDEFVSFRDAADPVDGIPGAGRIIDTSDETAPFVVSNLRLEVHDPTVRSEADLASDPGQSYGPGSFGQGYSGHYCAVPRRDDPGIVACSMVMSGLRVFDIRDPHNPVEIAYFNHVTPQHNPVSSGGAYAMSAPAFVPERGEIWYSDVNSGFYVVRLTNGVWPFPEEVQVERLAGPDRTATAVASSQATFDAQAAGAVVVARADDYADALAGGPLAVAEDAPILLSGRDTLARSTAEELTRVLPRGGTVHLLGGTSALSDEVARAVADLGYTVARVGGANRFETAALIAERLGSPAEIVVADGGTFADAVVAAPVAAARGGALLLTDGPHLPAATAAYLASHADAAVTAIGRPASAAVPGATQVVDGSQSGDVSVDVATELFEDTSLLGFSRSDDFPDALTAGAVLGRGDGAPVLLVEPTLLPPAVAQYLSGVTGVERALVFGGTRAVGSDVAEAIEAALTG